MLRSGWARVLVVASLVGVVSFLANITTVAQLSGDADVLEMVRMTLSRIVNSGTVWAGLLVLAGWFVRRPMHAALAGPVAGELALVVHYGIGRLVEVYGSGSWAGGFDPEVWAANRIWFIAALALGVPLGLLGAGARRRGRWGLVARLVVPVAAVSEPLVLGMFAAPSLLPAPVRVSGIATGVVLTLAGVIGAAWVLAAERRSRKGERVT